MHWSRSFLRGAFAGSSALPCRCCEVGEDLDGGVPVDAGVSDTDTVLEGGGHCLARVQLLIAFIDVALNHDTNDRPVACGDLLTDVGTYDGLVAVLLLGVAMGAVHDHPRVTLAGLQGAFGLLDVCSIVVCATVAASENLPKNTKLWASTTPEEHTHDVAEGIAARVHDR